MRKTIYIGFTNCRALRLNFIENNSKGNFDSKYKTKYFVAGNEIKIQFSSEPSQTPTLYYSFLWKNATRRNL
jgi:hypothetical protein